MSQSVIRVEHLSKSYQFGTISHGTLHKDLQSWWARLHGKEDPNATASDMHRAGRSGEHFWALKDISFDVRQGEIIGIIGKNGAGKSTLLKIISEITTPTSGCVKIKGRIASLLEVGTGFHPELTGGENIYLNGAILGMDKAEIKSKFDEIVAFAEVEDFIDTPVKRYSSGMYVRLAFAVAAHLEPDILLLDEVLAVGDIRFQKKCLGKMQAVSGEGRTVLFVSHSMPSITSLCQRALLLDAGEMVKIGSTSDVVMHYYNMDKSSPTSFDFSKNKKIIGNEYAVLIAGSVINHKNQITQEFNIQEPIRLLVHYKILKEVNIKFVPALDFHTADGTYAFGACWETPKVLPTGEYIFVCSIPGNFLNEGVYYVSTNLFSFESGTKIYFHEKNILSFNVKDPLEGTRNYGYTGPVAGVVRPHFQCDVMEAR